MLSYVNLVSACVSIDTPHTPEEGAHSPSWPNGLNLIIDPYTLLLVEYKRRTFCSRQRRPRLGLVVVTVPMDSLPSLFGRRWSMRGPV
jgi:hypothetical protein